MNIEQRNQLVMMHMNDIRGIANEIPLHKYPYIDQDELVSEGIVEFIDQLEKVNVQKATADDLVNILRNVKQRMVQYAEK